MLFKIPIWAISYISLCLAYVTSCDNSRPMHVAANGSISFFLTVSNIPLCIYTASSSLIHLSMDIWIPSTFWLLWTVLLWTLGECMYPFKPCFLLDISPGVGLLDYMVVLFLVFKGASTPSSIVAAPICIPINSVGTFTGTAVNILSSISQRSHRFEMAIVTNPRIAPYTELLSCSLGSWDWVWLAKTGLLSECRSHFREINWVLELPLLPNSWLHLAGWRCADR